MADDRTFEQRHEDAVAMQAIEGNPFDADDYALFARFAREGWSIEQCRAFILEEARRRDSQAIAAE